jgi:hypothetical protein
MATSFPDLDGGGRVTEAAEESNFLFAPEMPEKPSKRSFSRALRAGGPLPIIRAPK